MRKGVTFISAVLVAFALATLVGIVYAPITIIRPRVPAQDSISHGRPGCCISMYNCRRA